MLNDKLSKIRTTASFISKLLKPMINRNSCIFFTILLLCSLFSCQQDPPKKVSETNYESSPSYLRLDSILDSIKQGDIITMGEDSTWTMESHEFRELLVSEFFLLEESYATTYMAYSMEQSESGNLILDNNIKLLYDNNIERNRLYNILDEIDDMIWMDIEYPQFSEKYKKASYRIFSDSEKKYYPVYDPLLIKDSIEVILDLINNDKNLTPKKLLSKIKTCRRKPHNPNFIDRKYPVKFKYSGTSIHHSLRINGLKLKLPRNEKKIDDSVYITPDSIAIQFNVTYPADNPIAVSASFTLNDSIITLKDTLTNLSGKRSKLIKVIHFNSVNIINSTYEISPMPTDSTSQNIPIVGNQ